MKLKKHLAILVLVGQVIAMGCGKSAYEEKMAGRVRSLGFASKFIEGLHPDPVNVIEGVAELRLPQAITEDAKTLTRGAKNRRGEPVSAGRIEPPFAKIPGFKFTYEDWEYTVGRNENPVYCYFGSVSKETKLAAVLAQIQKSTRRKFKTAAWQDAQLSTPEGGQIQVKKMSVRGAQKFETNRDGGDEETLPGQCDFYVYSSATQHIIVGFRASDKVSELTNFMPSGELSLGTLQTLDAAEDDS